VEIYTGQALTPKDLAASPKKAILVRILHNLLAIAADAHDGAAGLRYLDAMVAIDSGAVQERWNRALLRFQTGDRRGALEDTDWLLEHGPPGLNMDRIREFRQMFESGGDQR
jgi:regulator of sirC expression with transglutaminase-like and TPR domain